MLRDAAGYLREARMVARRAHQKGGGTEVREAGAPEGYPAYYRQNFHFQSDGWFSDRSARAYDTQVEVLFTGAADTMRRRALALIADEVQRREGEGERVGDLSLVDIGTGTGRLLADVADNFPGLPMVGVDLSDPYLKRAKKTVGPEANARFVAAPGEKLPFADQSMDILTTVYLFHELPPKVRRVMAAEFARVLKPGGLYVHLDSVQYGDTAMDALLEGFPRAFHEPFYESYMNEDLAEIFGAEGLRAESSLIGFLSKASSFRKPLPS
jgi:ubiquinone/menaquinone biosynthesis C-methylase UbiE